MPVTSRLDASAFPHVVDHILDVLCDNDPLTAALVQTVCRDWHTKIRSRLFTHFWISYDTGVDLTTSPAVVASAPSFVIGTLPARGVLSPAASLRFTVSLAGASLSQVSALVCHPVVLAALRTVRILDIRRVILYDIMETIAGRLRGRAMRGGTHLDTIRLPPRCGSNTLPHPPADTLVIFHDPKETGKDLRWQWQTCATRVVVHATDKDGVMSNLGHNWSPNLPLWLENVTVFYPFLQGLAFLSNPERHYDDIADEVAQVIEQHFASRRNINTGRTLTVVSPEPGAPRFRHIHLADPLEPSWASLRNRFQCNAPHLLANVEFLTAAEYCARVGEETYNLHTYMEGTDTK